VWWRNGWGVELAIKRSLLQLPTAAWLLNDYVIMQYNLVSANAR